MNASKPLIFAASLLIASAGVAGIRAYANASASSVLPAAVGTQIDAIQTLPVITVRPSRADYERAFGHAAKDNDSAAVGGASFDMPYYSFAAKPVVGTR